MSTELEEWKQVLEFLTSNNSSTVLASIDDEGKEFWYQAAINKKFSKSIKLDIDGVFKEFGYPEAEKIVRKKIQELERASS